MKYRWVNGCHWPKLTLLETDVIEPELLFREIAIGHMSDEKKQCFQSLEYIFYRMKYEEPGQEFTGLKKLILEIRNKTGMRCRYKGIIGIDVSAWKTHESEKYFQVFQKYLYDNSTDWQLMFICCNYTKDELAELRRNCVNYYMIERQQAFIYRQDSLMRMIEDIFCDYSIKAAKKAVERLADIIQSESMREYRSLQMVKRIVAEMLYQEKETMEKEEMITEKMVENYLKNPDSFPNIISENCIQKEGLEYEEAV